MSQELFRNDCICWSGLFSEMGTFGMKACLNFFQLAAGRHLNPRCVIREDSHIQISRPEFEVHLLMKMAVVIDSWPGTMMLLC